MTAGNGGTRCASCIWWDRDGSPLSAAAQPGGLRQDDIGTCQYRAPILVKMSFEFAAGRFPQTHASRFCGDWDGGDGPSDDDGERISDGKVVPIGRAVA